MVTEVVDNTNAEQMLAAARGEKIPGQIEPIKEGDKPADKPVEAADKPNGEAKPVVPEDDAEDADGLTEAQKKELSAKIQSVVGKKHRQMKSAEEFAADQYNQRQLADQRAQKLQAEIDRLKNAQIRVDAPKEAVAPKREDFKTDAEYSDALIDWKVDQRLEVQRAADQKKAAEQHQQEVLQAASARIAHAIELVPDFKAVTEAADMQVPPAIAGYMQESDMFAELGYHLAKHPEELTRLQKLAPARQLVEIGKIESKLSPFAPQTDAKVNGNGADKPSTDASQASSSTDSGQSRSRAAVIKPLSSGSAIQVEKANSEMTPQEALADYQKKRGVNLLARKRH